MNLVKIEKAIDDAIDKARAESGCWCAETRKPCGYHEGVEEGGYIAMRMLAEAVFGDG